MKFVLFGLCLIGLIGQCAMANECPIFVFDEVFICGGGHADVVMGEVNGFPSFQFRGVPDSSPLVVADDVLHRVDYGLSKGEYRARCENGRLLIHSFLTASSGDQFEADDQVFVERKALVRVRVPKIPVDAKPSVTVCKPYIAPVH